MPSAQALNSLQIFVPAAPGGGWDQTGRTIELALRTDGIIKDFKFEHAPGAGGAVGLPKFVGTKKGQGDALMVGGMVMVGALIANKSPVNMTRPDADCPAHRRVRVIVVPAASPHKTMQDLVDGLQGGTGQGIVGRRLGRRHRSHPRRHDGTGRWVSMPKAVSYVAYAGGGPAQAALLGNQVTCRHLRLGRILRADQGRQAARAGHLGRQAAGGHRLRPRSRSRAWTSSCSTGAACSAHRASRRIKQKALVDVIDRMVKGPTWQAELKKKDWTGIYLPGAEFGKFWARRSRASPAFSRIWGSRPN